MHFSKIRFEIENNMLQSLFDEDDGGAECKLKIYRIDKLNCVLCLAYCQATSNTSSKPTIEKPLPHRNETNLCGLQNQGATW